MYTKHHTRGIVLGKHDTGEADRLYVLLTPDFGKIYAHAKGVRRHGARNKTALQTLSKASVSLVRGKTGWRVTNASAVTSLYTDHAHDADKLAALVRVLKLTHRLLAGEGKAHEVFDILESFATALETDENNSYRDYELLAVLRILRELGYIKSNNMIASLVADPTDFSPPIIETLLPHRSAVLAVINHALEASQL